MSQFEYKDKDDQGWDHYWNHHQSSGRKLYDIIASFYRDYLIKGFLNYVIGKNFEDHSTLLHAGCGSGQVDKDLVDRHQVTALDISPEALTIYRKHNGDKAITKQGSVFAMPIEDHSVDGIYNLGVMEHFTETDIVLMMKEFTRVLKPNGKVIMFWPPEFGLSVIFFKILTFIFALFGKKNIKFHPDEITRIRSKNHAMEIMRRSQYDLKEFLFSGRDAFTYAVITAEPKGAEASQ